MDTKTAKNEKIAKDKGPGVKTSPPTKTAIKSQLKDSPKTRNIAQLSPNPSQTEIVEKELARLNSYNQKVFNELMTLY